MRGQGGFRPVMVSVVLTAFWLLTAGIGSAADKVTLAFDWLTYGKMAPFYVGDAKGYYKAENLEVKLVRGFGSVDTAKRVGAKQIEFGLSTVTDTVEGRSRGAKIKTVWIYLHDTPGVVFYIKGKGINKPKDLEGRTMGGPLPTDSWVLFPLFAKAQGIDLAKVKHVNMRPTDTYGALAANVVDSVHSWIIVMPGILKVLRQKGMDRKDLGIFKYVSGGVSLYSQDLIAHEDAIKNNPDLVRRMVRAVTRAKVRSIEEPEGALEDFWKANPALKATSEEANREEMKISIELFRDEFVDKHGQGFPVREKMAFTQKAFVEARNLPLEPLDNIYTDQFVKGMPREYMFPKQWGTLKPLKE